MSRLASLRLKNAVPVCGAHGVRTASARNTNDAREFVTPEEMASKLSWWVVLVSKRFHPPDAEEVVAQVVAELWKREGNTPQQFKYVLAALGYRAVDQLRRLGYQRQLVKTLLPDFESGCRRVQPPEEE